MFFYDFFKKRKINKLLAESSIVNSITFNKESNECIGNIILNKFNMDAKVIFNKEDILYVEKCVNYLNNDLDTKVYKSICKSLFKIYKKDYKDNNGEYMPVINTDTEIFDYVSYLRLEIKYPKEDKIGICFYGMFSWEDEKEFVIILNDNRLKLVCISDECYDPWKNYNIKDNYAYNIK